MIMEVTKRLFVGNLPDGVTENEIRPLFNKFGRIDTLEIKTKKGVDGDVVSTFAFVDFCTSDAKLSKCLEKLNGSQVKNSQIRVQVAKENFLARLQSERTASKNDLKSYKRVSREPAPPVQDYNPMAMFKSRKVTNVENEVTPKSQSKKFTEENEVTPKSKSKKFTEGNEVTPKSKSKKFTEEELIGEDHNSGDKGNALSMLESFSGMWKDLDTAPVVVDREAKKLIKTDENKKSKATAEVVVEETAVKVKAVKKVVEDPKKKELDNQKRIQSLQQRNEALKAQQNLIKSALSLTDSQKNRKIVFNLDDEEEEAVPSKSAAKEQPTKKKGKEKKSNMKLFDDEDEVEADPEADSEQFRVKPHLEGKSGKELLELQSRFAHDKRFKLDQRFADDEQEERMQVDDEPEDLEAAEEKDRQMAILASIVPMAPVNASKKSKTIESTAFVRFDPTSKEHTKSYEKPREEPKPAAEKTKKVDKSKKNKEQDDERIQVPLPEVSSDRYYTTTSGLNIGSGDSGGFSLLRMFRPEEPEAEDEEEQPEAPGVLGDPVETHREEVYEVESSKKTEQSDSRATNYWKNVGMWHEPLFFQDKDSRLAEAMHFLTSKTDDVRYLDRSQWSDQRDHLIRFYKNKIRRLDSNLAGLRKRPLETADQADHFFSAQAAAVSASKKPRKKFYKKKSSL